MSQKTQIQVSEKRRQVVSVTGHRETYHDVSVLDLSGRWIRFQSKQGWVVVNPENVLCFIVEDGEGTP